MHLNKAFHAWLTAFIAQAGESFNGHEVAQDLRDLTLDERRPPAYVKAALDTGGAPGMAAVHVALAKWLWTHSDTPKRFLREIQGYYPDTAPPSIASAEDVRWTEGQDYPEKGLYVIQTSPGHSTLIWGKTEAEKALIRLRGLTIRFTGWERPLLDMRAVMAKWDARRPS